MPACRVSPKVASPRTRAGSPSDKPGRFRVACADGRVAGSAGLPTPPKRPSSGFPIRLRDLRSAAWLGQRPATTAATGAGSARVSRPRRNVPAVVSPFAYETFGRQRGSVRDRPQQRRPAPVRRESPDPAETSQRWFPHSLTRPSVGSVARSETGHNSGDRPQQQRPATTAATGHNNVLRNYELLKCNNDSGRRWPLPKANPLVKRSPESYLEWFGPAPLDFTERRWPSLGGASPC